MQQPYNYVIIKHNYPELERESTLITSPYKPKKKYAAIYKQSHKDGSESISFIAYDNDLEKLQKAAARHPSWYNYPLNLCKNMQGYIKHIDN